MSAARIATLEREVQELREELNRTVDLLLRVMDGAMLAGMRGERLVGTMTTAHAPVVISARERLEQVSAAARAHRALVGLERDHG